MKKIADWFRNHLISETRSWWRLWSARLLIAALTIDALALAPVLAMLPASVRGINPLIFDIAQMVLVTSALVARFIKQGHLEKPDDKAK